MKKAMATLLMATLALFHARAADPDLRLEMTSQVHTLRLGEETRLWLKIVGSGVSKITENAEGIESQMKPGEFVHELTFRPQREGKFTFGPYSLMVDGKQLTSMPVEITVLPQWDETYGTFFSVDRDSIALGEEIELVVETWSKEYEHRDFSLKRTESFTLGAELSGDGLFALDDDYVHHSRRSWRITPRRGGDFQITKELFKDFPAGIPPPNLTVKVEEKKDKAPPADAAAPGQPPAAALPNARAAASSLRFELVSPSDTIRLGELLRLKLKIVGSRVSELTENTEGVNFGPVRSGAFTYEITFNPKREGKYTFGPYSLAVDGKTLTTRQVEVTVLPSWNGAYGTFFRVDKRAIVLGEDINLVMETWAKKDQYNMVDLKRSDLFKSKTMPSGGAYFTAKDGRVDYSRTSWRITPKQSGDFQVNKDLFRELPADIVPPDFTIKVEEKKAAAPAPEEPAVRP